MFYDTLSAHTVKITLTRQDMSDYSIRSESLRSRSAESKRSLTRFLKKFQAESALFPDKSADRLFLEAFPSADGGCVMYVSTLGVEQPPDDEEPLPAAPLMCFSGSLAGLTRLCAGISDKLCSSALYRVSGGWCLIMTAERSEMPYISRLAGEYGEYSDDALDISCAAEHGCAVCRENAAAMLSELA